MAGHTSELEIRLGSAARDLGEPVEDLAPEDLSRDALAPPDLGSTDRPWYRLDGAALVARASDLSAPAFLTSLSVDPLGRYVASASLFERTVWTGGTYDPATKGTGADCTNWTLSANGQANLGDADESGSRSLYAFASAACNNVERLYCLKQ